LVLLAEHTTGDSFFPWFRACPVSKEWNFSVHFSLLSSNPSFVFIFCSGFTATAARHAFPAREFLIPRQVPVRCCQQCSRNRFSLPAFHLPAFHLPRKVSRARCQIRLFTRLVFCPVRKSAGQDFSRYFVAARAKALVFF
jgi:hypothetical protein